MRFSRRGRGEIFNWFQHLVFMSYTGFNAKSRGHEKSKITQRGGGDVSHAPPPTHYAYTLGILYVLLQCTAPNNVFSPD